MDSAEEDDPNVRFKTRFSVRRFENAMKCLTPTQRGFLMKHGYDLLLDIKSKIVFPLPFIDWIIDHIIPRLSSFQLGNRRIKFDKAMIQQFIAIPSGIFYPLPLLYVFYFLFIFWFMLVVIIICFFLQ
jgi:hypothetical protein